jgi:NADP-dependent 3-hydroxy acid dehydrogenase YdfG
MGSHHRRFEWIRRVGSNGVWARRRELLLGARRVDRLEEVAAAARKAGSPAAHVHALDVASTPSVDSFAKWARTFTDKVDVLINNAGGAKGLDKVAEGKDDDWEFMVQTNVLACCA